MKRSSYSWSCPLLFILLFITGQLVAQDSTKVAPTGQEQRLRHKRKHVVVFPRTWNQSKFILQGYPFAIFSDQLFNCTWQFKMAFEYRLNPHNSLMFGLAGIIPIFFTYSNYDYPAMKFRGGRGIIGYRHYFKPDMVNNYKLGWYIGGEVSVTGLRTGVQTDIFNNGDTDGWDNPWWSPPYTAHGILSNYNVTFGYVFSVHKHGIIDIGASGGYRYDYLWRHYAIGNLEFDINNDGDYNYLKTFPLSLVINIGFGGIF